METLPVAEPVNGVLGRCIWQGQPLFIYGNVITIKDQWAKDCEKKYSDRLQEQLHILETLADKRCIVAGDFNLRLGWPQKRFAYEAMKAFVERHGWVWPTAGQTFTVQHILHSPDLAVDVTLDASVQRGKGSRNGLSDHPLLLAEIRESEGKP
ncbi:MAG: endonuclease/exonuclease/phosphatase family protein [Caldilineales bacterium]|nr:endonuclease/exonuclease/phosphatase family protein [Caldilineales bacterium]